MVLIGDLDHRFPGDALPDVVHRAFAFDNLNIEQRRRGCLRVCRRKR
jgi:hypothetical protein